MPCSDSRDYRVEDPYARLEKYFKLLREEFELPADILKSFRAAQLGYDGKFNYTRILCTAVTYLGYSRVKDFLVKNDDKTSYEFLAWIADHREWDKKNGRGW